MRLSFRTLGLGLLTAGALGGPCAARAQSLALAEGPASVPPVWVGPQAPTAPSGERLQQLRTESARRAPAPRAAGALDGGYQIDTSSREAVRLFYATVFASSQGVASDWTGSVAGCLPGTTSAAYQQATLRRINWFRAMAGVPAALTLDAGYSHKAQQTALMMAAQRQLDHFPGLSWACHSAQGAEGAANANLALGRAGADAVADGYMWDSGANNAAVGHRRWLLYPQTRAMGVGDAAPEGQGSALPANALWVFDGTYGSARPAVRDDFVAWPPPGFVPSAVVYPRWSVSLAGADFSRATVRMTENGQPIATRLEPLSNGAGEPTLVWLPAGYSDAMAWATPARDTTYTVTIDGVLVQGQPRSIGYRVTVFDPYAASSPGGPGSDQPPQGPTSLAPGQPGSFGVPVPVAGAHSQWRALTLAPYTLQDGAEAGSSAFEVRTSPGYPVLASDVAASGARSFHLAHTHFADQLLQLKEVVVPGPATQLEFSSRLGVASAHQQALVEVSADGGASWQVLYRQAGQQSGNTSGLGEVGFSRRSLSLAAYADQTIRLRWRYALEGQGPYYPQSTAGVGWYIDDVALSGAQRLASATAAAPVSSGAFSFTPAAPGTVLLQVRHGLYGHFDGWGPALRVAVAGTPVDTAVTQGECVLGWAERLVPELLFPPERTRTDIPGLRYRFYGGSGSYLGVATADRHVYFLAGGAHALQDLGPLEQWLGAAGCR